MLCVKCPMTEEWQMLKGCMPCSFDENMIKKGEYKCSYDEYRENFAIDYIRRYMSKEEIESYANEKLDYEELNGTIFYYNPTEIDTDEVLDNMIELSEHGDKNEYTMVKKDTEICDNDIVFY